MEQTIMENDTPNLPLEIIRNILVRLTVKSLIRFQCVCKDWKNLFKTPSFIAEHLHHSTQQNHLLIVDDNISGGKRLRLLNREMQVFEFQKPHIVDSLMSGRFYSSNGLLCVKVTGGSQDSFWLWNPAIRVVRQVPKSHNNYESLCSAVGFGFSPINNDYKIVKLFSSGYFTVSGEVYSLRTGLWRKLEVGNLVGVCAIRYGGFPCNGAIFWTGQKDVEGHNKSHLDLKVRLDLIVSFDIAKEVFTLIPFPTMTSRQVFHSTLDCYENKLAIFSPTEIENSESYGMDLWVLEECADPSKERWRWAKIYTSRPNPYGISIYSKIIWRNEIVFLTVALPEYQIEGEEEDYEGNVGEEEYYEGHVGEEEYYEGKVVLCNLTTDEFNIFDIPISSVIEGILDYMESLVLLDNIHV